MDVDATFAEHDDLGGNDWRIHDELFILEYEGAAKEYGSGITFIDEFDHDQFAGEHIKNLYYPFTLRDKWEFAAFLLHSNLSMASIDSLCYIFTILYFYSILLPLQLLNSLAPRTHGYTRRLYPDSFLYL